MPEILPISPFVADFTQECLTCHETIYQGEFVVTGALNHFTNEPIWMHPRCAQWYRMNFGTRAAVDDGWRIIQHETRCKSGCDKYIVPGEKAYRRWVWGEGLTFVLQYECHPCRRSRNGATVELPA